MKAFVSRRLLWFVFGTLIFLGISGFVLRSFWHPYQIPTGSMAPALPAGSHVFVNDWAYTTADDIKRGDVIVFDRPSHPMFGNDADKPTYVFRVIGLPNDQISFDKMGRYRVNGPVAS